MHVEMHVVAELWFFFFFLNLLSCFRDQCKNVEKLWGWGIVTLNFFLILSMLIFLLLIRIDSFLRIRIFTENLTKSGAKSWSSVANDRKFCLFFLITYLRKKLTHLKISVTRKVHILIIFCKIKSI